MNKNQSAALVQSQAALMLLRMEGMKAENQWRLACGQSPAYVESNFADLEIEFDSVIGYNNVIELFQSSSDAN